MSTVDVELLLAALDDDDLAVAVLEGSSVRRANRSAERLGDLPALAARITAAATSAEPADTDTTQATIAALRDAHPAPPPSLHRGEDGRAYEVHVRARGALTILTARDVTQREHLRGQLARADEILSLAAHELKGPLHVLGMACHLMESRAARRQPVDDTTIERLRRQIVRLNRLINGLLDATRAQEGRLTLDLEEIDLAQLVRDEIGQAVRSPIPGHPSNARQGDVTLRIETEGRVRGDRARLAETVHQLIDNALRFTPAGTPIEVTLFLDQDEYVLRVLDRGPGVAPDDRQRLFSRETRRDRRRGAQGLGLGLFVAATVVRLHGGALGYEPTEPAGATFSLRLRRLPPAA